METLSWRTEKNHPLHLSCAYDASAKSQDEEKQRQTKEASSTQRLQKNNHVSCGILSNLLKKDSFLHSKTLEKECKTPQLLSLACEKFQDPF